MIRQKILMPALGMIFILASAAFLLRLYPLCGGQLIGFIFGAKNNSVWEHCKLLGFPYFIWSALELMYALPVFRRFTVAKVFGLCFLIFAFCAAALFTGPGAEELAAAVICVCLAQFFSFALYYSGLKIELFFYPALFALMVCAASYFCFTPFPRDNILFFDRP